MILFCFSRTPFTHILVFILILIFQDLFIFSVFFPRTSICRNAHLYSFFHKFQAFIFLSSYPTTPFTDVLALISICNSRHSLIIFTFFSTDSCSTIHAPFPSSLPLCFSPTSAFYSGLFHAGNDSRSCIPS